MLAKLAYHGRLSKVYRMTDNLLMHLFAISMDLGSLFVWSWGYWTIQLSYISSTLYAYGLQCWNKKINSVQGTGIDHWLAYFQHSTDLALIFRGLNYHLLLAVY